MVNRSTWIQQLVLLIRENISKPTYFSEIKGRGPITDEHAQAAVGAAVKYQLLPSVILSQLGYESAYGQSQSGRNDTNFLGLRGFLVVPIHKVLHVGLVALKVVSI